jgi:hypothetical protein
MERAMRAFVVRVTLAALIGLFALPLQAIAGGVLLAPNATIVPAGYDAGFRPWCAAGGHYACHTEPYGTRFCGCWLGTDRPACPIGYFFACGQVPNGPPACGCY